MRSDLPATGLLGRIRTLRRAGRRRLGRVGFSLLEVMIASAILVATMAVIVRIQTQSVSGVARAQKIVVATDLCQEKLGEVMLLIEREGIGTADIYERGDFDDFGQDQRLDFDNALEDYRWEYWVEEIDFALNGDLFSMFAPGGDDDAGGGGGAGMGAMAGADPAQQEAMMQQFGLGPDQLTENLGNFIRRVRVRVYWGDESKAEEKGREVIITTHIISPQGAFRQMGGDPNNPNAGAGGPMGGVPGGGRVPGGGGRAGGGRANPMLPSPRGGGNR